MATPLIGRWTSTPGRIVDIASDATTLALAEVPEAGEPMRVHVGSRVAGQWCWLAPWTVPRPPSVSPEHDLTGTSAWLDIEVSDEVALALNRIEYQGGSHGIALAQTRDGVWTEQLEILSPTDSDIAFGTPALRRGDELFTTEWEDQLWHYVRVDDDWGTHQLPLPLGASFTYAPAMSVTRDRRELAIAVALTDGTPHLVILRRDPRSSEYGITQLLPMPGFVNALVHADSELFIGFGEPTPEDASTIWVARETPDGRREVDRHIDVPAPGDPKLGHLADLDVSDDWLLLVSHDEVWALSRAEPGSTPRRLELGPREGDRLRYPQAVLLGREAAVLVGDQLGLFALE